MPPLVSQWVDGVASGAAECRSHHGMMLHRAQGLHRPPTSFLREKERDCLFVYFTLYFFFIFFLNLFQLLWQCYPMFPMPIMPFELKWEREIIRDDKKSMT